MSLAQLAYHHRHIIEIVNGAILVARILPLHHEIGSITGEASGG